MASDANTPSGSPLSATEPGPAFMPGEPVPPAATGVPLVGGEEPAPPHAHTLSEMAEEIEEEVEGKAAMGFLGGPVVWGLLAILALAVVYFIAS